VVNSALFALYHVRQVFFGLLMQWRKNLYPLIAFHFLVNIVWGAIIGAVLK
jgi:membrane protease YdiL (CAAX protease family)